MITDFKSFSLSYSAINLWKYGIFKDFFPHLKRVTTLAFDLSLITTLVREFRLFSDNDVLQGSAETRARCGAIFNNHFTANFLENLSVENFENRYKRYTSNIVLQSQTTATNNPFYNTPDPNNYINIKLLISLSRILFRNKQAVQTVSSTKNALVRAILVHPAH